MNNDYMMYFLLKNNPNLSEIKYHNNIVEYQGKILNISNIFVGDLMQNGYDALPRTQGIISSEDFFCILDTNATEVEPKRQDIKNLSSMDLNRILESKAKTIINPERYFELLDKEDLSDMEYEQIKDFELEISQCLKYCDYLLKDKRLLMDDYYSIITELEYSLQQNPNQKLTPGQQHAIDKYYGMLEMAKNYLIDVNKKTLKPEVDENAYLSAGYANAFIVLLATIATGIIAALALYFTIK